ncbi:MAG: TetR/AcrR family transcriptional regulator, partial [Firmicutes bacterium]|nr:TetR/AcrR family transcriptional regulator [Bacillota bacterium]
MNKENEISEHILTTAGDYFLTYGCSNVTMSQLAKELSISKRTIYKYFDSKEQLLEKIIDSLIEDAAEKTESIIGNEEISIAQKIMLITKFHLNMASRIKPPFMRDLNATPSLLKKARYFLRYHFVDSYKKLFSIEKELGNIRTDVNVDLLSEMLLKSTDILMDSARVEELSLTFDQTLISILKILGFGV